MPVHYGIDHVPHLLVALIVAEDAAKVLESRRVAVRGAGERVWEGELFMWLVGDFPGVVVSEKHKEAAFYPLILLLGLCFEAFDEPMILIHKFLILDYKVFAQRF